MTTKTVNLYQLKELSAKAKEKARNWWRECENQDFGHDDGYFYEQYQAVARMLGIEFKTHGVKLIGGSTRYDPCIWWCLHVQGCGASFEGNYSYAKGAEREVRAEFGGETGETLQRIARELQSLQRKYFYKLTAKITTDSRSVHKYSMDLENVDAEGRDVSREDEKALLELMRDFADWIYKSISEEYGSRMTDEYVDDAITANEYTFLVDGTREN